MKNFSPKKIIVFAAIVTLAIAAFLLPLLLIDNRGAQNQISITRLDFKDNPEIFREAMRDWVILIADTARKQNEDFLIIPQNCAPLFTANGSPNSKVSSAFIQAIDGIGQEGLTYGDNNFNELRGDSDQAALTAQINIGRELGLTVLCTDYCDKQSFISHAQDYNTANGFLGFQANSIELNEIQPAANTNTADITHLSQAQNYLILLNPASFRTKEEYLTALSKTNFDVLIIDAFYDENMLNNDDLSLLREKPNGGARLIISYLSIGEAEDYRRYWKEEYTSSPPSWLLPENPSWAGNYPVEYWNPEWQDIIALGENSYLNSIIAVGFNGVYLDIVDGYETFEDLYQ